MIELDFTHDARAQCWLESARDHRDFPVQNLPFGVYSLPGEDARCGVAIGDAILDLAGIAPLLSDVARKAAHLGSQTSLNAVFAHGSEAMRALRHSLFRLLTDEAMSPKVQPWLRYRAECTLHVPFSIGDYTDFYAGIRHAENVGRLLRPDNPLLPNYKFVPIGYHGRSSSIRPSGVDVRRPQGQTKQPNATEPVFGPCKRLDYELELAIWVGEGNVLGAPVQIGEAGRHIAGLSLLNDWSARDIQAWEYQPLGPFLAKNFHSTISPWVVTMDALAPFRVAHAARPDSDPRLLPYLLDQVDQDSGAIDITLEVSLRSAAMRDAGLPPLRLSRGSSTAMYWTVAQLVTHHTSSGCNLTVGDLLGTGTLSGDDPSSFGSLMEISRGGSVPFTLPTGETRTFLEDGDEVTMTAFAVREGHARIGFGDCVATVLPA